MHNIVWGDTLSVLPAFAVAPVGVTEWAVRPRARGSRAAIRSQFKINSIYSNKMATHLREYCDDNT